MLSNKYLLLGIVILAIALRLYGFTSEGIWIDEAVSVYHAGQGAVHVLGFVDTNPPLHLLVLQPFTYFGLDSFWIRMPFLICGVLSVLLIYLVGKELFNRRVGLYSSLILALSSYHIYYSQEARPYALLAFLSLASFYFFITYLKSPTKRNGLGYLITTSLAVYTHYFGAFLFIAQNVYLLLSKERPRKWLSLQGILIVSYIPAGFLVFRALESFTVFWLSSEFLTDMLFLPDIFSGNPFLAVIYVLLSLYGIFILRRNRKALPLLLVWILLPILIPLGISLYKIVLLPRYVMYISFPFFILAAFTLDKLKKNLRVLVLLLVVVLSFTAVYTQAARVDKEDWREVSFYVNSLPHLYTNTIIEPGYNIYPYAYYNLPECFKTEDIYTCAAGEKVFTTWGSLEDVEFADNTPHIIYIVRHPGSSEESQFLKFLKENYQMESSWSQAMPVRGSVEVTSWRK